MMTQKEAKKLSLEMWRYLAEHPEFTSKSYLPDELWEKICDLKNECSLCELFINCTECPLDVAREGCLGKRSAYDRWANADSDDTDDTETRRKAATRIVEIISAWKPKEESK